MNQDVQVVDGRFEVLVNFGADGTVFDDTDYRWLQVEVRPGASAGSFDVLTPRQRIVPAPASHFALKAASLRDTVELSDQGLTLRRSGGTEEASLSLGSPGASGEGAGALFLRSGDGLLTGELRESTVVDGGWLRLYQASGFTYAEIEPDVSIGGGGYFRVTRDSGNSTGFEVDGNNGNGGTSVRMLGDVSPMVFDTSQPGNESVRLPNNAVGSAELLNEAGASETENSNAVTLTPNFGTNDVIESVTIDCPGSGVVLVLETFETTVQHTTGFSSSINFGISDSVSTLVGNSDIELRIPSTTATNTYDYPLTVHQVYGVDAGSNTFYLIGDQNDTSSTTSVLDTQLTAVYLPTEYGNVARSAGRGNRPETPDAATPVRGPKTGAEVRAERDRAINAVLERQRRELDAMRARVAELERSAGNTRE